MSQFHSYFLRFLFPQIPPFIYLKEDVEGLTGNQQYEGFCIELIEKLGAKLGFNYTFIEQTDKTYGTLDKNTKQWNGMLRRIMDGDAELAITDLTITSERENAVDFTMPFMTIGISMLFEKAKKKPPELFSFTDPFSPGVWGALIGSFFLVSFSLVINMISKCFY